MSYYYNYFIGYKDGENKIYPVGPFDMDGKIHPVLSRSRSFASDLHEEFFVVNPDMRSEALNKHFSYENYKGETELERVQYLPAKNLPAGSFVKSGYFLSDDILRYREDNDAWDLFYDHMTPEEYAMRMQNELTFGKPAPKLDEEGEEMPVKTCADYAYFAYEDTACKEYESNVIRHALAAFEFVKIPEGAEFVVLETEG